MTNHRLPFADIETIDELFASAQTPARGTAPAQESDMLYGVLGVYLSSHVGGPRAPTSYPVPPGYTPHREVRASVQLVYEPAHSRDAA